MFVHLAGNALREDFTFRHTFSSDVSKLLKASPGEIVIVQPEKFRSKYEPASHTFAVKVLLTCSVLLSFFSSTLLCGLRNSSVPVLSFSSGIGAKIDMLSNKRFHQMSIYFV